MDADFTSAVGATSSGLPMPVASRPGTDAEALPASSSKNIRLCLFLVCYFSVCDTCLKFFPVQLGTVLRYLPEALLYFCVLILLSKRLRILSFPLLWPLAICGLVMTISGLLNRSPIFEVAADFRIYFRFAAFAYILWRTTITPRRIEQLIGGFLGLTVLELVVGAIELIGGNGAQKFFSPALGWGAGTGPTVWQNPAQFAGVWVNGTLGDNNRYGIFMVMSCILALTIYFMRGSARYLWLSFACVVGVFISFSRHSIGLMVLTVGLLLFLQRKRIPKKLRLARLLPVAFAACLLAVAGAAASPSLRARLASGFTQETLAGDPTANIRLFMTVELTPRFLNTYPFFGQGPIAPADDAPAGEADTSQGPQLKAARDVPGWATFFLRDVVWLTVLGLYGCVGLAAFALVFCSIVAAARKVIRENRSVDGPILAQSAIVMVVLFILSGFFSQEMIARDAIPIFWSIAGVILSLATHPRATNVIVGHS